MIIFACIHGVFLLNNMFSHFLMQTKKLQKSAVSHEHCTLRCLEVLFLWNSLSTCRISDLEAMLEGTALLVLLYNFAAAPLASSDSSVLFWAEGSLGDRIVFCSSIGRGQTECVHC